MRQDGIRIAGHQHWPARRPTMRGNRIFKRGARHELGEILRHHRRFAAGLNTLATGMFSRCRGACRNADCQTKYRRPDCARCVSQELIALLNNHSLQIVVWPRHVKPMPPFLQLYLTVLTLYPGVEPFAIHAAHVPQSVA